MVAVVARAVVAKAVAVPRVVAAVAKALAVPRVVAVAKAEAGPRP